MDKSMSLGKHTYMKHRGKKLENISLRRRVEYGLKVKFEI
jgi:hypothetical protein